MGLESLPRDLRRLLLFRTVTWYTHDMYWLAHDVHPYALPEDGITLYCSYTNFLQDITRDGQTDLLKWLQAQLQSTERGRVYYNDQIRNNLILCFYMVMGGHLEMLQWAIAHGFTYVYYDLVNGAKRMGHDEIVQWLKLIKN